MITPNMNLDLPTPSVTIGPEWAALLNAAFELVDTHDHSEEKGVRITPSGLNINADLPLAGNNVNTLRGLRMNNQGSAVPATGSDIRMVYVREGELYYNDDSGNQVRITLNGAVDVSATGAISGLTSPASAVYNDVLKRFVWSQDTNQRADMVFGRAVLSDPAVASAKTITLQTPANASYPSSYSITLPVSPPSSGTGFLSMNTSGVMANSTANQILNATDGSHDIPAASANKIREKTTRATGTSVGVGGVAISNSSGAFSTTSSSFVSVTNLSVTLTTSGRPVLIFIVPSGSSTIASNMGTAESPVETAFAVQIRRSSTVVGLFFMSSQAGGIPGIAGSIKTVDTPSAGSHSYNIRVRQIASGTIVRATDVKLVAYEL